MVKERAHFCQSTFTKQKLKQKLKVFPLPLRYNIKRIKKSGSEEEMLC